MSIVNMWVRNPIIYTAQLFFGLVIFCAYVAADTQLIIDKASRGSREVITHALDLFIDFIGLFVRILSLILKYSDKVKRAKNQTHHNTAGRKYTQRR